MKKGFIALGSFAIFVCVLWAFVAPLLIQNRIEQFMKDNCTGCEFKMKRVTLKAFPLGLALNQIEWVTGNADSTLYEVSVEQATFDLSIASFMNKVVKIRDLEFKNPQVTITEGDVKSGSSKSKGETTESEWGFEIGQVKVKNGAFNYHRIHLGKTASIHLDSIYGSTGKLGSGPEFRKDPVSARVLASLEDSGKVELSVSPYLFSKTMQVEVDLKIDDLDLSKTRSYFYPASGLDVRGFLTHLRAKASVRSNEIQSRVHAEYYGLKITFNKTRERSGFMAGLMNFMSRVSPKNNRERETKTSREAGEPPVGFILHGIANSALKVVKDPEMGSELPHSR